MNVSEIMSKDVMFINKKKSVREAAKMMKDRGVGALPVEENNKLIGMVTDRDLVLKVLADAKDTEASVESCLDQGIKYCFDDQDLGEVAFQMSELKIRRMPVMNRDKKLVGIVSLGDIAVHAEPQASQALEQISK